MRLILSELRTFFFIMSVTSIYDLNHSRDGESAAPEARESHKNDIQVWYPDAKDGFLVP